MADKDRFGKSSKKYQQPRKVDSSTDELNKTLGHMGWGMMGMLAAGSAALGWQAIADTQKEDKRGGKVKRSRKPAIVVK